MPTPPFVGSSQPGTDHVDGSVEPSAVRGIARLKTPKPGTPPPSKVSASLPMKTALFRVQPGRTWGCCASHGYCAKA